MRRLLTPFPRVMLAVVLATFFVVMSTAFVVIPTALGGHPGEVRTASGSAAFHPT